VTTTSVRTASTMCRGTCTPTCKSYVVFSALTPPALLLVVVVLVLLVAEVALVLAQAAAPGLMALHILPQALHPLLSDKLCSHALPAVDRGK